MDKTFITSGIALATALINLFVLLYNSRNLERLKARYSLKSNMLNKLWEMRGRLIQVRRPEHFDTIRKDKDDPEIAEKLNKFVHDHREMLVRASDIYLEYKSFFSKQSQNSIEIYFDKLQKLEEAISALQDEAKENQDNKIDEIIQKKSEVIDISIKGYREIFEALDMDIEKLQAELGK